jgi:predicted PurR-regulated permease PerM
VQVLDRRALRVLITTAIFLIVVALLYCAADALLAILFAFFFAYMLEPLVGVLNRLMRGRRMIAIAVAYFAFAVVIYGAVAMIGPMVQREGRKVAQAAPQVWQQARSGQMPTQLHARGGWAGKLEQRAVQWIAKNQGRLEQWGERAAKYVTVAAAAVFWAIVIPILAIWVLKDKGRWIERLAKAPESVENRHRLRETLVEIDRAMARYIWAQLLLSLFAFGAYAIVLSLLHLPFALLLAVFAGVLELIFVFGPLVTAVVVLAVAVFSGHSPIAVLVFLIAWRVVQDYVNTPLLFGERLEMHPLIVVIVLMIGWTAGNVIGMFIAVPIAAAVQIAWGAWSRHGKPIKDIIEVFKEPEAA